VSRRDSNRAPSNYESGVSPLKPTSLVEKEWLNVTNYFKLNVGSSHAKQNTNKPRHIAETCWKASTEWAWHSGDARRKWRKKNRVRQDVKRRQDESQRRDLDIPAEAVRVGESRNDLASFRPYQNWLQQKNKGNSKQIETQASLLCHLRLLEH
jgi:hypothetical protein